ncbi:MAG: universal stress protein [Pyrinomonadaceae bacterium]
MMKVLIGYDGSPSADAALEELKRAGLPGDARVLVVTVGDIWTPPADIASFPAAALTSRRVAGTMAQLQNHAERTLKEAEELSGEAAARIKSDFPDWQVGTEITSGNAALALIVKKPPSGTPI